MEEQWTRAEILVRLLQTGHLSSIVEEGRKGTVEIAWKVPEAFKNQKRALQYLEFLKLVTNALLAVGQEESGRKNSSLSRDQASKLVRFGHLVQKVPKLLDQCAIASKNVWLKQPFGSTGKLLVDLFLEMVPLTSTYCPVEMRLHFAAHSVELIRDDTITFTQVQARKTRELIKQTGEQILFEGDRKQVYAGTDNPMVQNCVSVLSKHFPQHSFRDGYFLLSQAGCQRQVVHWDFEDVDGYRQLCSVATDWTTVPMTAIVGLEYGTRLIVDLRPFNESKMCDPAAKLNLVELYLYPDEIACFLFLHAGSAYKQSHARFHIYGDVKDLPVKRSNNGGVTNITYIQDDGKE